MVLKQYHLSKQGVREEGNMQVWKRLARLVAPSVQSPRMCDCTAGAMHGAEKLGIAPGQGGGALTPGGGGWGIG